MSIKDPANGYRQKGVTSSPKVDHDLQLTPDWEIAKNNTYNKGLESAFKIIDERLNSDFFEAIQEKIEGLKNIAFMTVPSTTGKNKIPVALAERIQEKLNCGKVILGEKIVKSFDVFPMKNIPKEDRVYSLRNYSFRDNSFINSLKNTSIVVIEDIITTGASAKAFIDCLRAKDIPVIAVACLQGEPKLYPEPVLVRTLKKELKNKQMTVDSDNLCQILSREQVAMLIKNIKKTKDNKNEQDTITRNLSGVLNARLNRPMGSDTNRQVEKRRLSYGNDRGNARPDYGVRTKSTSTTHETNGRPSPIKSQTQPIIAHNNHQNGAKPQKIFLDVPRMEEETKELNKLGTKWDRDTNSLYIMSDNPNRDAVLNQVEAMKQAKFQEELAEASMAKNKQEQGVTLESKQTSSAQTDRQSTIKPK